MNEKDKRVIPTWRYWIAMFAIWFGAWFAATLSIREPHTYWYLIPSFISGCVFAALLDQYRKGSRR